MMQESVRHTSYEQVPYLNYSHLRSHPDRLATLATLMGMKPPPITHARVLELGCALGGNLIPMAWGLPDSSFIGLDNSPRQIAAGQARIAELGLKNISLQCLDILEITPELGQFDYIIAHGVYSWVPPEVQEKIIQVCKQNLSPNGVAYVSYNTYPGWHMMNIVRDAMFYHTRRIDDPHERAAEARDFVGFMAKSLEAQTSGHESLLSVYAGFLQAESQRIGRRGSTALLHDELAGVNIPVYFSQFAARAAEYGLQYLAEADLDSVLPDNLPPEVGEAVERISHDIVEMEQYLDFLRSRMFRRTLLCHDGVPLRRMVSPERLQSLYVASRALPLSDAPDIRSISVERFGVSEKATLTTDHPVTKAAMVCLSEIWPRAIAFEELFSLACSRSGLDTASDPDSLLQDATILSANLLRAYGYSTQLVELHTYVPQVARDVSERPVATPVARLQAEEGSMVTSVWHERARLSPIRRHLLRHLDGNHDQDALLDKIVNLIQAGTLSVKREGRPVTDPQALRDMLAPDLNQHLRWFAQAGLLIG